MALYLLHQRRDGTPIGIWTEADHVYFPENPNSEKYGQSVIDQKSESTDWDEFAEQLARLTPSPRAMWDLYESDEEGLEQVLREAQRNTD